MPFGLGWQEILIVLVIALVVFGPKRLPEMGRSLGKGIREFKTSVTGEDEEVTPQQQPHAQSQLPPAAPPPPPPAAPTAGPAETAGTQR